MLISNERRQADSQKKYAETRTPKLIQESQEMNGLRVYINTQATETHEGCGVFYSRRADGPYYRWRYDEKVTQWRVARMRLSDVTPKVLCTTNWKALPTALQRSMVEHYQE